MTLAEIGHNQAPDPIDEALSPYGDDISEAENWLDGKPVENAAQMAAIDAILKNIKAAEKSVKEAEESEAKPIYDQWKAAKARYAPTLSDLSRIKKGLVATVDVFKRKLKAEKDAAERAAWEAANKARREAEEKARAADASNLEAQREAQAAKEAAIEAEKAAQAAKKDQVKGLRTVTRYTIDSYKTALADIYKTDPDAIVAFVDEYVRRNHKTRAIAGVTVTQEQEAY